MKKTFNLENFKINWPYYLFIMFFVVVAVNIGYIFIANKTWRGIYSSSSYQKTSDYNKILEKIQEQRKLGYQIKNNIKKIGHFKFQIETTLTDLNNNVMSGVEVLYKVKYLPDEKLDKVIPGNIVAQAFSYVEFELNKAGTWELETIVSHNNKVIQDIYYFIIKPQDIENKENFYK